MAVPRAGPRAPARGGLLEGPRPGGEGELAPCFTPQPRPASACLWPTVIIQHLTLKSTGEPVTIVYPTPNAGQRGSRNLPLGPWAFEKHMLKVNDLDPLVPRRGSGTGLQVMPLKGSVLESLQEPWEQGGCRQGLYSPAHGQLRDPWFQGCFREDGRPDAARQAWRLHSPLVWGPGKLFGRCP